MAVEMKSDRRHWDAIFSSAEDAELGWYEADASQTLSLRGYFDNLRSVLKASGHALFAEFSLAGAPKCAGLTLHRYSVEELSERLGPSFALVWQGDHTYVNPWGEPRPYLYALYRRSA